MAWTVAIGVDTHKDLLVAVACDRLGRQLDSCTVEPDREGCSRLLVWAQELGQPAFAIEGCGSYGAGLADFLAAAGIAVFECERPRRRERRRGKNDLIDAALAARRLLSGEGLSLPRGGGLVREQLRLLLLERRGVIEARTAALNQLHAVALTPVLPARLRGLDSRRLVEAACSFGRRRSSAPSSDASPVGSATWKPSWRRSTPNSRKSSLAGRLSCSRSVALAPFVQPN